MAKSYKVSLNNVTDASLLVLENKSTYIANTKLEDASVYADYMIGMITPIWEKSGCLIVSTGNEVTSEMSGSANVGIAGSTLDSVYGGSIYTRTVTTFNPSSDSAEDEEETVYDEDVSVAAAEGDASEVIEYEPANPATSGHEYGTPTSQTITISAKGDLAAMSSTLAGEVQGFATVTLNTVSVGSGIIGGKYDASFSDSKLNYADTLPFGSIFEVAAFVIASGRASVSVSASGKLAANASSAGGSVTGYKEVSLNSTAVSGNVVGGALELYANTTYDDGEIKNLYASLELRSSGAFSADNSASATAVVGYGNLSLANNSKVTAAIGGKLDLSGAANRYTNYLVYPMDADEPTVSTDVIGYNGNTSESYTTTYISGGGSLASTGKATVNNSTAGTLIGYGTVTANSAELNNAVAGSKELSLSLTMRNSSVNYGYLDYSGKASGKFTANLASGLANLEGYATVSLTAASGAGNVVGGNCTVYGYLNRMYYNNAHHVIVQYSGKPAGSLTAAASELGFTGGYSKVKFTGGSAATYAVGGALDLDVNMFVEPKSVSVADDDETELKVGLSLPVDPVYTITSGNRLEAALKASGSAELEASSVGKAVGYGKLTLASDAAVDYAVGGNIRIWFKPIYSRDDNTLTITNGDVDLTSSGTLKLTGSTVSAAAVGYKSVTAGNATAKYLVGGEIDLGFRASMPVDVSAFNLLSPLTLVPQLVDYAVANAAVSVDSGYLKSTGKATIGNGSEVDNLAGYLNVTASYSTISNAVGGNFTFAHATINIDTDDESTEEAVQGLTTASYAIFDHEATGSFKATYSTVTSVVGYKKVEFKGGETSGVALSTVAIGETAQGVKGSSLKFSGTALAAAKISGFSSIVFDNVSGTVSGINGSDLDDKLNIKRGTVVLDGEFDLGDGYDTVTIDRNATLAASAAKLKNVEAIRGRGTLLVRAGAIEAGTEVASGITLIELDDAAFDTSHATADTAAEAAEDANTGTLCLFNTSEWFKFSLTDDQSFSLDELTNTHYALYTVDESGDLTRCYDYTLAAGDYRLEFTLADENKLYGTYKFTLATTAAEVEA